MSKPSFHGLALLAALIFWPNPLLAANLPRFAYMGDGQITVGEQNIRFRLAEGVYDEEGLKKLHRIFQGNWEDPEERLSLRFLEMLDYLQDQLQGGPYILKSGYRSPALNQSLRDRGKLAAQSSMHQEGAAADLILNGVPASRVFEFVKELNCCGIGWYHGKHFHLDTGPSRYWDEKTSKTEDKTPQRNEKIILQTEWDRYLPGEKLVLQWMRVTDYPFGIPTVVDLVKIDDPGFQKRLEIFFPNGPQAMDDCRILASRKQARSLTADLPKDLKPGTYSLQVQFCNRFNYEKMPEKILSRPFEIKTL